MAKRVQIIGNSTVNTALFVGLAREITVDTDRNELIVNTGAGAGTQKRIPNKETNDTLYQTISSLLTAIAAISATDGFLSKTAAATVAARTNTGTTNQINVTNGGGAAGNPTFALSSTMVVPGTFTSTAGNNVLGTTSVSGLTATLLGTLTGTDQIVKAIEEQDVAYTHNARGSISGSQNIDYTLGSSVSFSPSGTLTLSVTNPPATGKAGVLFYEITNGGAQTINWPSGTKWDGGAAPTLTTSGVDLISAITRDGGTTWRNIVGALGSA